MKKIMFNDRYGLTQAVLEGRKTQTRRIVYTQNGFVVFDNEDFRLKKLDNGQALLALCNNRFKTAHYKIGETIAIAKKYDDLVKDDEFYRLCGICGRQDHSNQERLKMDRHRRRQGRTES